MNSLEPTARTNLLPVVSTRPAGDGVPTVRLVSADDWLSAPPEQQRTAALQGFSAGQGQAWAARDGSGDVLHIGLGAAAALDVEVLTRALHSVGRILLPVPRLRLEAPAAVLADCGWALGRALTLALQRALPLRADAGALDDAVALLVASAVPPADSPREPLVHLPAAVDAHRFADGVRAGSAQSAASVLVDLPPNLVTPAALADVAVQAGAALGGRTRVVAGQALVDLGAGGLVAIGSGSAHPPHLVHVSLGPQDRSPDAVMVGKGITFDSGGLSIKDATWMSTMKCDMAGAAAVLAAACSAVGVRDDLRIDVVLALAENMPGTGAARPGDVVRTVDGTTVELLNIDFEGRVVLADALGFAFRLDPLRLVDVATLTESVVLALGSEVSGVFATDDAVAAALQLGGREAGEPSWRMPLFDRYDDQLRSDLADLRNYPEHHRFGRSITAARFLAHLVPAGTPWAHLDIAGSAWDAAGPGRRGGTGVPTGTLLAYLTALPRSGRECTT